MSGNEALNMYSFIIRTVQPQLYTTIKQSAGLKYNKSQCVLRYNILTVKLHSINHHVHQPVVYITLTINFKHNSNQIRTT